MRNVPAAFAAHLASECTTMCHCFRLTSSGGSVLGFTDHDHDITFDGTTFRAASGLSASDAERQLGLAAAGPEVIGALSSDAITEADIAAGKYDGAQVELWLVNWADAANPDARVLLRTGELGRVRRGEAHFEAEVRTLAARLRQLRGRVFAHGCDAALGDDRCRVNLNDATWRGVGTVLAVHGVTIRISGLSGFAAGFFTHGALEVTNGAAVGFRAGVLTHRLDGEETELTLASVPPPAMAGGDGVQCTAGCDKSFSSCCDKFANAENFRGFPHMPGNDFVISYPVPGDGGLDGGSMNQ